MGQPYRLVVFDWEGTIGDTLGQVIQTMVEQAEALHFGSVDLELARKTIALGPVVALKQLFPHLSTSEQAALMQAMQNAMIKAPLQVAIMPGAEALLTRLNQTGIQLAIATNKGQTSLGRDLECAGLQNVFTVTRSASQVPAKPCPQMLEEIMQVCDLTAEHTLMVGDSVSDIEMAKQINVDAIGVDFYYQNETALRAAGALDVFNTFQQLADYLSRGKTL